MKRTLKLCLKSPDLLKKLNAEATTNSHAVTLHGQHDVQQRYVFCLWTHMSFWPPLLHSVTAGMNLATLHRTAPTRFLPQEHHATKKDFIQGIDIPMH